MKTLLKLALVCAAVYLGVCMLVGYAPWEEPVPLEVKIRYALAERDDTITVTHSDWDEELGDWENAGLILEDLIKQDPGMYWVDWSNTTLEGRMSNSHKLQEVVFHVVYHDGMDLEYTNSRLEARAEEILREVPAYASDWEKARIIHDSLARWVTYEDSPHDQTIYGALIEGRAVCNGIALAYEYLLEKAGIPCDTFAGYGSWTAAEFSSLGFARHAWNVVTLTGEDGVERNCYVDVTWDNTDRLDTYGVEYVGHEWFCMSQQAMDRTGRVTMDGIYDLEALRINHDALYYLAVMDAEMVGVNLDSMIYAVEQQRLQGQNLVQLIWQPEENVYAAAAALEEYGISQPCQAFPEITGYNLQRELNPDAKTPLVLSLWFNLPRVEQES